MSADVKIVANAPVFDNRKAFGDELIKLAESDSRIVAVCNDSVGSSNLGAFREAFPDRLINVGIAEQDMVGVGAGLANAGFLPFVSAAGPFLSARATEQIKADIAYAQFPVILCAQSPGMSYGELGPTHHSIEDVSIMRTMPGLDIIMPADHAETRAAMRDFVANPRPTYMRVGRFAVPNISEGTSEAELFVRGKFRKLREGTDATIISYGTMISRALLAAESLAQSGVQVRVLNANNIAPLDENAIDLAAEQTKGIVVAEEATNSGALGAAVAMRVAASAAPKPVKCLGISGRFAPTGSNAYLLEYFGLSVDSIEQAVKEIVHGS